MTDRQPLGEVLAVEFGGSALLVKFARGQHLFHRGDPVNELYLVRTGRLRLTRVLHTGTPLCLQWAGPGTVLAEASIYAEAYHCSGDAETDGSALAIPIGLVRRQVRDDPSLAEALICHLASTVVTQRSMIELRNIRRADERVLAWLELHRPSSGPVYLGRTVKDWASELGLSHEAVYRALASLEGTGRITRQGGTIKVVAPDEPEIVG